MSSAGPSHVPTSTATMPSGTGSVTSDWLPYVLPYCLVLPLALLGNILVLIVVYQNTSKRLRTPTYYFLVNLAVSDLLVTVCDMPEAIKIAIVGHKWLVPGITGSVLCKVAMFMWYISIDVSIGSLVAMTIHRFLLVIFPHKTIVTKKVASTAILTIWLMAAIFTLPPVFAAEVVKIGQQDQCLFAHSQLVSSKVYTITYFSVFIATPLLVMGVLYSAIFYKLLTYKIPGGGLNSAQHPQPHPHRRILIMVVILVVLFACCWGPIWVGRVICQSSAQSFCMSTRYWLLTQLLGCTNSALNPLCYLIFSEHMREGAKSFLKATVPCLRQNQVMATQEIVLQNQ